MASIIISYAYTQNEADVAITFCSLYSLLRWVSVPICPLTIFFLSWHFFLSSRRADQRALRVPKHAMSIFLMMIPLATAWFDDLETVQVLKNQGADFGGKKTAEQKRRELKSLAMRDGPRPRQTVILVFIGVVSVLLGLGKLFTAPKGPGKKEFQREYFVQLSEHSSKLTR